MFWFYLWVELLGHPKGLSFRLNQANAGAHYFALKKMSCNFRQEGWWRNEVEWVAIFIWKKTAANIALVQVLISSTFYVRIFRTHVVSAAFLWLHVRRKSYQNNFHTKNWYVKCWWNWRQEGATYGPQRLIFLALTMPFWLKCGPRDTDKAAMRPADKNSCLTMF